MEHPSANVVAEALGFMVHASRTATTHRITGFVDGCGVTIRAPHGHQTWEEGPLDITVDAQGAMPRSLEVTRAGTLLVRSTYDDDFDRAVAVRGEGLIIAALFGQTTRRSVRALLEKLDLRVAAGVIRLERSWRIGDDYAPFVLESVRQMIELAKLLSIDEASIPRRLVKNALEDRARAARQRSLELVLEHFPDAPEAGAVTANGTVSEEERVRAIAAKHLGEAGARWAREVLETITADEPLRVDALEHLVERFPASLPDLPWLLREVHRAGPRMAVVLARALGIRRDGSAEAGLIEFLRHHPNDEVKIGVAEALGELGTVAAVAPLLQQARRFFGDARLRNTARAAIERIQARAPVADRGALSLALEAGGEVSIADGGGALSLLGEEREREE